jgi:hypothetical protein
MRRFLRISARCEFLRATLCKKWPMAGHAIGQVIYAKDETTEGRGENRVSPGRQSEGPEHGWPSAQNHADCADDAYKSVRGNLQEIMEAS